MLISLLGLSSAMKVGLCSITNRLQAFFKYGSNRKYSSEMAFWRRLLNCITCEKSMNIVLDSLPLIASISASQYGSAALFLTLKLKFHPQISQKKYTDTHTHTQKHKNFQKLKISQLEKRKKKPSEEVEENGFDSNGFFIDEVTTKCFHFLLLLLLSRIQKPQLSLSISLSLSL